MHLNKISTNKFYVYILLIVSAIVFYCNQSKDQDVKSITLNVPANANLLTSLRKKLTKFKADSGIEIKLMPFSGQEKLYAMMAAGKPPDIFYTNTVVRDRLAAEGHLLDLHTVANGDSFVKRIRPAFIKRGTSIDGGWYQFCDWTFTYGVYFNKTLFDQANLPYPDSAWTWKGMLESARKLTKDRDGDGKNDQFGIFISRHFVSSLERMNGAEYPASDLFFHIPAKALEAQQAYLELMFKDHVMPELALVQAQGMQLSQMLNTGKIAMIVEAVPNLDFITSLKIDWDVAPLPKFGNNPPLYFRSASGGLSISSSCAQPQAAWNVIKWLVTQSDYNMPNPILNDIDFVANYEDKYPELKYKNFALVWNLSEQFDGGDTRDFVRYSAWSSSTILEQVNPKLDLLYAGKISLEELLNSADEINTRVRGELKQVLNNKNIRPAFREGIIAELKNNNIDLGF
jgi:ABC-type glycerol-3-phosphate transport system substrate-binding protein